MSEGAFSHVEPPVLFLCYHRSWPGIRDLPRGNESTSGLHFLVNYIFLHANNPWIGQPGMFLFPI